MQRMFPLQRAKGAPPAVPDRPIREHFTAGAAKGRGAGPSLTGLRRSLATIAARMC